MWSLLDGTYVWVLFPGGERVLQRRGTVVTSTGNGEWNGGFGLQHYGLWVLFAGYEVIG